MAYRFLTLPDEMQVRILEECDLETLYSFCLANRELYAKAHPILWTTIDFISKTDFGDYHDAREQMRRFFRTCEYLQRDLPMRWEELRVLPTVLRLSCLPGTRVPVDRRESSFGGVWVTGGYSDTTGADSNVYEHISRFLNLHTLTVFIKDDWESRPEHAGALEQGLTHLRNIKLGGIIPEHHLLALLARPEQIETLSLINLVETPGQDSGPKPVLFLEPMQTRFSSLRRLHLSKLAELHEDHDECMGLRWEFDGEQEEALLREWAGLLWHVCTTLVDLRLENCYHSLVYKRRALDTQHLLEYAGQMLKPYSGESDDDPTYGGRSSKRCGEILGPALEELEWPRLEKLTLKGMYSVEPLSLKARGVEVVHLPGSMANFEDEVTPLELSPPRTLLEMYEN